MMCHLSWWRDIVSGAIFCLVVVADFSASTRGGDTKQKVREAALLDRIFANWKARHDRVHSLHFTWDCRSTYRKGAWDLSKRPRTRFEREQVFEQFGVQLWIDGDERICLVITPLFKIPEAKVSDTGRAVGRWVTVGRQGSSFIAGRIYETGDPGPQATGIQGMLFPSSTANEWPDPRFQALLLAFRPQHSSLSWLKEQCRLVDENAGVDNGRYIKFERAIERSALNPQRTDACWVSPVRDDAVVHWTIRGKPPFTDWEGSIKCKKDEAYGWIPSEWTTDFGDVLNECRVTSYAINEKIDPAVFSQRFPAGTPVQEQLDQDAAKFRYFVLQQDGSKRTISPQEYARLAGFSDPAKK
jgi:hypothetical protein